MLTQDERRARRYAYMAEYRQRSEVREQIKAYRRAYRQRPEVKEAARARQRKLRLNPEYRERERAYARDYMRGYFKDPAHAARHKELERIRRSTPEFKYKDKLRRNGFSKAEIDAELARGF